MVLSVYVHLSTSFVDATSVTSLAMPSLLERSTGDENLVTYTSLRIQCIT